MTRAVVLVCVLHPVFSLLLFLSARLSAAFIVLVFVRAVGRQRVPSLRLSSLVLRAAAGAELEIEKRRARIPVRHSAGAVHALHWKTIKRIAGEPDREMCARGDTK